MVAAAFGGEKGIGKIVIYKTEIASVGIARITAVGNLTTESVKTVTEIAAGGFAAGSAIDEPTVKVDIRIAEMTDVRFEGVYPICAAGYNCGRIGAPAINVDLGKIAVETGDRRIKAVYEKRSEMNLNAQQLRAVEEIYKGFERSGANLPSQLPINMLGDFLGCPAVKTPGFHCRGYGFDP